MSIVLTGEESLNLRKQLLHPDDEHIKMRDELFKHIDKTISIRKDGDTVIVDCKKLELSYIDNAEIVIPADKGER